MKGRGQGTGTEFGVLGLRFRVLCLRFKNDGWLVLFVDLVFDDVGRTTNTHSDVTFEISIAQV
jgi:hypothetical protein